MIILKEWYIGKEEYDDEIYYLAWGYVFGHPILMDGLHIHTSRIMEMKFDECDKIIMRTQNNEYVLMLKDMNLDMYENTEEDANCFDVTIPTMEDCRVLVQKEIGEQQENVDNILQDGELYLKIYGPYVRKAFWKNKTVKEIKVTVHSGMFQDSYLVTDWENGEVDFRYFDGYMEIRPYHYSDGLKAILIENCGDKVVGFSEKNGGIFCKPGEITRIESDFFKTEGLFSPDAVNGKSVFDS